MVYGIWYSWVKPSYLDAAAGGALGDVGVAAPCGGALLLANALAGFEQLALLLQVLLL